MLLRHLLQTIHKNKGIGEIKSKGRAEMKIIIATKVKKKKKRNEAWVQDFILRMRIVRMITINILRFKKST